MRKGREIYHEAEKKPAHGGGDAARAERTRICNAACIHQERVAGAQERENLLSDFSRNLQRRSRRRELDALGAGEKTLARYDEEITILKKAEEMLWEMVRG